MKPNNSEYAVTNEAISIKYYDTENIVTRNSLLNILHNRLERGDVDAKTYINDIEATLLIDKSMYTPAELLFIATHVMVPYSVVKMIKNEIDMSSGMKFELGGENYVLDEFDMLHGNGESSPVSPEFLVRVINQYDIGFEQTKKIMDDTFGSLCDASGMSSHEYIKTVLALIDYIKSNRVDGYINLDNCEVKYISSAIDTLDKYDIKSLQNKVYESITPLTLSYQLSRSSILELRRSLKGGLRISDRHIKGILLSAGEWRDIQCRGSYVIKINKSELKWPSSEWSFVNDDESELVNIALNIVGLCTTMNNGIESVLTQQTTLRQNSHYDIYIYDKNSTESIIALGLAMYRTHKNRNFNYEFLDVNDDIGLNIFNGKSVCFVGCIYDDVNMTIIDSHAKYINILGNVDDTSVVVETWESFIGKPQPFLIKLFDVGSDSCILNNLKRGIERTVNETVLQTIIPLTEELVETADEPSIVIPPTAEAFMKLGYEPEDDLGYHVVDYRIR